MAGSECPSILETTWIGIPCLMASVAAVCLSSWKRTSAGSPASSRNRLKERITESRRRTLPRVLGKARSGAAHEGAAIRSSSCRALCALTASAVRGPMPTLRSSPVLVVEIRVFVRVSAERRTMIAALSPRSTSSQRKAGEFAPAHPGSEGHDDQSLVSSALCGGDQAGCLFVRERAHGQRPPRRGLLDPRGRIRADQAVVRRLVERRGEDALH